jgi:hypothetical protein
MAIVWSRKRTATPPLTTVRLRGAGDVRDVVTANPSWIVFSLLLLFPALILVAWLGEAPTELRCGWDTRSCVAAEPGAAPRSVALGEVRRFEVRSRGSRSVTYGLFAVTDRGDVALVWDWSGRVLREHERALTALLRSSARPAFRFTYDHRRADVWPALSLVVFFTLGFGWIIVALRPFRVRLDLREGTTVAGWLVRRRRPLSDLRAVQLRTWLDARMESLARTGKPRRWIDAGHPGVRQLVLVAADGTTLPLTRLLREAELRGDLGAVAAEVAAFLGVPIIPPPPAAEIGAVPRLQGPPDAPVAAGESEERRSPAGG